MMEAALDRLIDAQAAHAVALGAGEIDAIETTAAAMKAALSDVRTSGMVPGKELGETLAVALKAAETAKARLNFLADRNQRQFDRLAGLAGAPRAHAYGRAGRLG